MSTERPSVPHTSGTIVVAPGGARRMLGWAALGAAAFTVYGSLVPFQFRELPLGDAVQQFRAVLAAGVKVSSRSDAGANVLLGVPLGFTFLGLCAGGRNRRRTALVVLALLPVCALFAAGVEFAQLFTAERTCAASDIVAQTLGAAVGMAAWLTCGPRLTESALGVWHRADPDAVSKLLIAYVAFVAFVQLQPLDLTASPRNLYHKLRALRVPFVEFDAVDAERWATYAKLVKLAALYFPIGLLAARLKGRIEQWGIVRVAAVAVLLGAALEASQLFVGSRRPATTDALVGAGAALVGWYAGRVHSEGLAFPFAFSWGLVWLAGMTVVTQPPPGTPKLPDPRPFDWTPGAPLETGDPLFTLEEILTKLVLFGLLGVIVAAWRLPPRTRRSAPGSVRVAVAIAAVLGLAVAALIESGQRWYATNTPSITDVLLGGIGAALAVMIASRLLPPPSRFPSGRG